MTSKKNFSESVSRVGVFDLSLLLLLVSNIITIFIALRWNWSLAVLMWVYLSQSVIIGIFNFIRIIRLKQFSTENFQINNMPVAPTKATKIFTAVFFAIHYGFFHLGYALFLIISFRINLSMLTLILPAVGVFFFNHLFSYLYNKKADESKKPNIGRVMFFPYARIIPMHLIAVSGLFLAQSQTALLAFLILKTIADLIMHTVEHYKSRE